MESIFKPPLLLTSMREVSEAVFLPGTGDATGDRFIFIEEGPRITSARAKQVSPPPSTTICELACANIIPSVIGVRGTVRPAGEGV
jgi:hypothetical protein